MTPLHDACINGHLEVIRYLLDRGASVLAKTDEGETPLVFLKQWRQQADSLTDEELHLYNSLVERMSTTLQRFGQKIENIPVATIAAYEDGSGKETVVESGKKRERRKSQVKTPSPSPRKRMQKSPKKAAKIGEARRRICEVEDEDSEEEKMIESQEEKGKLEVCVLQTLKAFSVKHFYVEKNQINNKQKKQKLFSKIGSSTCAIRVNRKSSIFTFSFVHFTEGIILIYKKIKK